MTPDDLRRLMRVDLDPGVIVAIGAAEVARRHRLAWMERNGFLAAPARRPERVALDDLPERGAWIAARYEYSDGTSQEPRKRWHAYSGLALACPFGHNLRALCGRTVPLWETPGGTRTVIVPSDDPDQRCQHCVALARVK